MPYKLVRFEKEEKLGQEPIYVALVEKEGENQPFRVSIEHFKSEEEAMEEVNRWIANQDAEDARFFAEREQNEKEKAGDATLEALNNKLNNA